MKTIKIFESECPSELSKVVNKYIHDFNSSAVSLQYQHFLVAESSVYSVLVIIDID